MVDSRPSKKLRIEPHAADANANATATRTNSHDQRLFWRQNRWMHGAQAGVAASGAPLANAPAEVRPNGGQERTDEDEGRNKSPMVEPVHYESPFESPATLETAASMQTTRIAQNVNGRNTADSVSAAARQLPALPSPAPSDETTRSPTFSEGQLGQLGARRGYPGGTARVATPSDGVAMHITAPSTSATGSPLFAPSFACSQQQQSPHIGVVQPGAPFQPGLHPGRRGHPSSPHIAQQQAQQQFQQQFQQQAQQQAQHQAQVPMHRPPSWQSVPGPRSGDHSRSNSMNVTAVPANMPGASNRPLHTPPTLPSNNHSHPMPRQTPAPASRRPSQALFAEIDHQERSLSQAGRLSLTNNGRLVLLRDAVEKGDWFYQILSQLFCLRSIAPDMLPQSIRGVGAKSFEKLDAFLCSNKDVNPELLRFFSRFPEPIMDIYSNASSDARDQYETRLRVVKDFLTKLPTHWDGLLRSCKDMQSPPLVQDMVEALGLQSVVLQTTAFRLIARTLWDLGESKALRAFEELHHIDQEMYYRAGWRRNREEKLECYKHYHYTFQRWAQAAADQKANFTLPGEVLQYFRQMPQSTMIMLQRQQSQMQQAHQRQVQQAQAQQAQANMRPTSPALANQQHMQRHMRASSQAQGGQVPSIHPANNTTMVPATVSRFQTPGAGHHPRALALFPPADSQPRAQPTHPEPNRSALHQAHLRSPVLGPIIPDPDAPRMYRHVVGYALPPTKLKRAAPVQQITFTMREETLSRLARNEAPLGTGQPPRRTLTERSLTLRLRCCSCPMKYGFATESSWVTADNYWPDEMSFRLNGNELETRRKLHHGRYLPIDLTEFVREGFNILQITTIRMDRDLRKTNYAVAVEAVGTVAHDTIKKSLKRISAADSLAAIKKSLSGEESSDDDIAVTSSSMTIKLVDPYSGCNMVNIPVRSSECLHHDCFDLEVFLSLCKRPHDGWPTLVDCWRCPLCRSDVRPQMLIVDEFLLGVRDTLAKQGLLNTRAIVVEADGSWRIKEEEQKGVRSPSLEREEQRLQTPVEAPKKAIEVIELD